MVNTGERLLNAVTRNTTKMLRGLSQKAPWIGGGVCPLTLTQMSDPPAQKQNLLYPGSHTERGKPVTFPNGTVNRKDDL